MSRGVALFAVFALAACGSDDDGATAPATVPRAVTVTGTLDLERPAAPPDAGTAGGHNAPDGVASTPRSTFSFTGRLRPADAVVYVRHAGRVVMEEDGRFTVALRGLRRGTNRIELEGRRPGARSWRAEVSVTRTG